MGVTNIQLCLYLGSQWGAGIFKAVSNLCGPHEAEDNRRSKAHAYPSVKGRRGWQTVLVEIFGTSPTIPRCINSARR